jgi:hypothetical protein
MTRLNQRLQKLESATKPEREVTVLFAPKKGASDSELAEYQQDVKCAQAAGHRVLVVGFVGVPPPGVEAMTAAETYFAMLHVPTLRPQAHGANPMLAAEAYQRMTAME